ncbi:putative spermidine/putrescine transport system permease protein [Devosia lucknowensis]|uniref:Putative spermidine/putrescine transport system permease protein n=1 Tax=Devosia lucknowensis TaxID=1096929 RepID=A0A1Y6G609_9HYPH|nr:ABC transporter permease [Devosia lucknowensis]SMQ85516.1 putative spermidine/putrescine transport system permease protein [Devosia lucknowensis]
MTRIVFGLVVAALFTFILAPTVIIALSSFGTSEILEFPPQNFTLRWYAYALSRPEFTSAAWNSLWLAVTSTAIATPLAVAASIAVTRGRLPGREVLQTVLLAPLVVPSVVIGLAILLASSRLGFSSGSTRLIAAHVLIVLPYLVRTTSASLMRLDPLAEEAARSLGANSLRTFLHVTLPGMAPGLLAGMIFAFIISFDNVSISLFLANARTNTLPLSLMSYVEYNLDPSVAAVSTLLILLALVVAIALERFAGLRKTLGA